MRRPLRALFLPPCDGAPSLAAACGVDMLVLDLGGPEAGDRAARRAAALAALAALAGVPRVGRRTVGGAAGPRGPLLAVRIAALASGLVEADLDAVMAGAPDAILLPGAVGAADVQHLAAKLAVREAERGAAAGSTGIVAAAADTARGVLALSTLPGASPRLLALAWDAAALAADLGTSVDCEPCRVAHALLLTAAAAAGTPMLEAVAPGRAPAARG